ncbi:hypothetical protein SCMU_14570 [Sinomonas cyclohexanicum]|uniref:DUF7666 domain-containing protein n=1 Tax=Sinomonas cyclohexanicum TaxID=322009 RepID=A0ABM7PU74_SINCY|nr:DUF2807 domain-containing protein [Corynebacterium cyclohexanicum]BCT75615.1 hypothetical protein SCMU_14570 [Corynebacterium cyclohexanicum]
MATTVTTQTELDNALNRGDAEIIIDSPAGVWIHVKATGSSRVVATGSSRVVATGSSRVVATGSSRVEARGSSRVEARDSSRVEATGSSRVEAWDSSRVEASKYVAIHLHSARATVTGGTVIDIAKLDLTRHEDWADYHGVATEDGHLVVYKAVDADLKSGRGFHYPVGGTVECSDWDPADVCGGGLHFSPSPAQARDYHREATRFLKCLVHPDDVTVIDGADLYTTPKLKARRARVVAEVDIHATTA